MLFNSARKTKVNYFVVTDHNEWHRALYQPIEPALHNKAGCPAMGSVTNRIFNVKPLISLDIVFGHQNTELYYNYEFDKKEFSETLNNHDMIKAMIHTQQNNGIISLHYNLGIVFFTDDKDLELMLVGQDGENCTFTAGAFNIHSWLRPVNASWYLNDSDKEGKISVDYYKPVMQVVFNKPVELNEVAYEGPAKDYYEYMQHVNMHKRNISKFFYNVKNKRPTKLL